MVCYLVVYTVLLLQFPKKVVWPHQLWPHQQNWIRHCIPHNIMNFLTRKFGETA